MIKVNRTERPAQLTDERKRELTDEYIRTKKNVWNQDYIKNALLAMSHDKCIFCECKLGEESKYIEVEHFHPKSKYPDEVMEWVNLLPICKRCNGLKRDHDTKVLPIINPTVNDPKNHLSMFNFRFNNKDDLGKKTIRILQLNDSERLFLPRVKIGNAVSDVVDGLIKWIEKTGEVLASEDESELISRVTNLLIACQPEAEYSATCSYDLFSDVNYSVIKNLMKSKEIWSEELERLESNCLDYCLIQDGAIKQLTS